LRSLDILGKLEKKHRMSLFEKILAVTNGSVTQLLEVYLGGEVKLRTLSQDVEMAGVDLAGKLAVKPDDMVNSREVEICDQKGKVLVKARSYSPLERLDEEFKEDLMKADEPIGRLFIKHRIEARRELVDVDIEGDMLKRTYNIIRNDEVLMRIEEEFELGTFKA